MLLEEPTRLVVGISSSAGDRRRASRRLDAMERGGEPASALAPRVGIESPRHADFTATQVAA